MQLRTILTLIALSGALGGLARPTLAASSPTSPSTSVADDTILDMAQAFKLGKSQRLTELLPKVRGHILEPWAAYWELHVRLDTAKETEITEFLQRYQGTYQEDRLRNDWLLLLGQYRQWNRFVVEAPLFRMKDDPQVRCYTLAMEQEMAQVNMAKEVGTLWLAQKDSDDACAYAAQVHHDKQLLSDELIWQKARMAMEMRRPRAVQQALDMVAPRSSARLNTLSIRPEFFLTHTAPSEQVDTQELVVLALIKLAQTDTQAAAELLSQRWTSTLRKPQRDWAWASIGAQAAQNLSADAVSYFAKVKPADMPDVHLVWYARAALRQGDWTRVLAAIAAMTPETASHPVWQYWRARGLLAGTPGEPAQQQARTLLEGMAGLRGFYEMLALEELGLPIAPPATPEPLTELEKAAAQANPGLQRALAAIKLGLRSEGVREWNYSTNLHTSGGMSDRELLAAADLACRWEIWDRCINTSERTKTQIDLSQRFPMPHKQAVVERSKAIGLDPAYVYGLIRQESRFVVEAQSGVGASGLMQVMPATARWTAKKIGLTGFKAKQLNDSETNIAIGTGYLKLVLDNFDGSMPMAAAAYNAGPSRPRAWRGQSGSPSLEAAIWAETIPFNETRDYVKKVLANTTIYAAMLSGKTQSLKARLGKVGPRDAVDPANSDLP
jgi:soluble lytic murein transglycosylase